MEKKVVFRVCTNDNVQLVLAQSVDLHSKKINILPSVQEVHINGILFKEESLLDAFQIWIEEHLDNDLSQIKRKIMVSLTNQINAN